MNCLPPDDSHETAVERSGSVSRALDWGSKGCEYEPHCLFSLILYVPVNIFNNVMMGHPGLDQY